MAFIVRTIRGIGGIKQALRAVVRMNEIRIGTLAGTDRFGNKYYENDQHFFGRNRWVDYGKKDSDPSQVPPEWHRWLHYIGDHTPVTQPPEDRKFHLEHTENYTGTRQEYIPYSTTRPKIESWKPPKISV